MHDHYDVIVVGAGPAGLTLAIDMGQRGVRVLLLERNAEPGPWPKMERTNARTMEFYRRLGLAQAIRAEGYPADASMDVFAAVDLATPIAHLRYQTVAEQRSWIARTRDGTAPLEPYQLVSQYALEPVLKSAAERTPGVTVCFGHALMGFEQDESAVSATVCNAAGMEICVTARYLVGCDGGASFVRKTLGIPLEGEGGIKQMRQVQFRSQTLYDRIPIGKGRHYYLADGAIVVTQGNRVDFTLHTDLPADTDFEPVIRRYIPVDFDLEVLRVNDWTLHLLVAARYADRRVFLAGDAVHLVIPTGGLGMNTAVGDVLNLSWKLAAAVQGWAGEGLLASYEIERRPVGLFNRDASGWAAQGPALWQQQVTSEALVRGDAGVAARAQLQPHADRLQRRVHEMTGAELGYHYAQSPVIEVEDSPLPVWDLHRYVPTARPGARLPHMWLSDGRALFDLLGAGFSLLDLRGGLDTDDLAAEFASAGVPVVRLVLDEPALEEIYGAPLVLVRPDLHVAWRGHSVPGQPCALVQRITGWG
ncbi:FAD-dependent monooxygenase [Stenotrophomonas tumulicola]|uniref:FAD-dependent monooxygenase n=1 Tax=Stenotrophomonas tumulicola TaxID=1685415 RepID=A0A7W3FNF2_9GAMM|nr:FAD-dependent monooxygenase [Stenotrophomonas tumulicola]MBA8682735.1 FAD-dependent monooxygenase [Stenotrophomonas tumulicola]